MAAILRCIGESLDIDQLQKEIQLEAERAWKIGEKRTPKSKATNKTSGIAFYASDAAMEEFDEQVKDSIKWLNDYSVEVSKMVGFKGVEEVTLDFGISLVEDRFINSDYLPPALLKLAGSIGIGIELSHYPESKDD